MAIKARLSWCLRKITANRIVAAFTVVIAFATILQWRIYKNQLDEMRIDQRAWFAVEFTAFPPPTTGAQVPVPLLAMNIGKTVAKNVDGWVFFRPVPISTAIDLTEPSTIKPSALPAGEPIPAWIKMETGVVYPNNPVSFPQVVMVRTPVLRNAPEPVIWDSQLQNQWTLGEIYLALHGKFSYDDAAGNPHWTTFCSTFVASGSGKNVSLDTGQRCAKFNAVDGQRPN